MQVFPSGQVVEVSNTVLGSQGKWLMLKAHGIQARKDPVRGKKNTSKATIRHSRKSKTGNTQTGKVKIQ